MILVLEKGALLEITQEVLQLELEHAGHEVGPVVVRLPGLQRLCDLAPGGVARHGDEHGALAVGGGDSSRVLDECLVVTAGMRCRKGKGWV